MIDSYVSAFTSRYVSKEMSYLFSSQFKYSAWRRLWVALASAQKKLGLPITEAQVKSMQAAVNHIDLKKAAHYETLYKHDVMAHIYTFADAAPEARGIIHLGATSSYVTDNGDLIQMHAALHLITNKLLLLIRHLSAFARKYAALATLSYTHFQSAQPTTVGKRACLWLQDFHTDYTEISRLHSHLRFLGVKGATGTAASFLALFDADADKVKQLEALVSQEMGFSHTFAIAGQTYPRKQDSMILHALASFAASAHKFATDIRLLCHLKEIEEPFAEGQVGSSAMPYKRNPMRSERICGISRFLISLNENPLYTQATQWLERSLDDSSNRRLYLPESFLAADALLNLLLSVAKGLIVYPKMIEKHLSAELPFLATENFLMAAVKKGKDRQRVHERLRLHSLEVGRRIKEEGLENDLLARIAQDPEIALSEKEIQALLSSPHIIGLSEKQTHDFLNQEIAPLLAKHTHLEDNTPDILI